MHRPPAGDGGGVPRDRTRPDLIVLLGPTGVGKTAVAVRVAERVGGEIVGCDALQVYRGFDAATAKPDAGERARVPHHLVDCVDPRDGFTLADYVRRADAAIADIRRRRRVPLVVGGTGMYLRGLLRGVVDAPPRDGAVRDRLRRRLERDGPGRLHRILGRVDPAAAERIGAGDAQRIVRALEVAIVSGEPLGTRIARRGTWSGAAERYRALKIGLDLDREILGARLARRAAGFFDAGLIDEVRSLLANGVPAGANAFKAIGYREALAAIRSGAIDRDRVVREIAVRTRQFAKRQRTWFRSERDVRWLDAGERFDVLVARIERLWRGSQGSCA